jgi:hypothetical protein
MPRRIEIELTSHASGTWTWRAAGARQPKGTVPADLVPASASVGDVLRAEIETGIDGIEIVALTAPPSKVDIAPDNRIEVLGSPRREPDVSVTLATGARRTDRAPRRGTDARRPAAERSAVARRPSEGGRERSGAPARQGSNGAEQLRPPRAARRRSAGPAGQRDQNRDRRTPASTVHRNAMLATLGPEQLPVAEQLLRGGIPAVRNAIAEQSDPRANADRLLAIAEQLLPVVNLASWKDRAAAAQAAGKELRLRDLRAIVTASRTVTLDDEGRTMAKALRHSLDERVTMVRDQWLGRIRGALESGRVLDSLRIAARPPDAGTRLPAEVAVALADAAGSAMAADTDASTWVTLLDAVVDSPVRRTVKPGGIPGAPSAQEAALRAAGLVPELAKLLGLRIPPPPPRRVLARVTAGGGGGSAGGP